MFNAHPPVPDIWTLKCPVEPLSATTSCLRCQHNFLVPTYYVPPTTYHPHCCPLYSGLTATFLILFILSLAFSLSAVISFVPKYPLRRASCMTGICGYREHLLGGCTLHQPHDTTHANQSGDCMAPLYRGFTPAPFCPTHTYSLFQYRSVLHFVWLSARRLRSFSPIFA